MKKIISLIFVAILGSLITLGGYNYLVKKKQLAVSKPFPEYSQNAKFASFSSKDLTGANFIDAAEKSVASVVHIKSIVKHQGYHSQLPSTFRDFFGDDFFGYRKGQEEIQQGIGSGVIISSDGYIVTNDHVVNNAEEIVVVLHDKRNYKAKIIGTDPSTDIALIKIDETDLPSIIFTNSDDVRIGEWVLAVGNPFSLSSTVTAGIVSAKARNINILQDRSAIESFIQTDAAVNPGNSGGALVDIQGELIGINTAIATPTGVYAGYSFAVPSNIVAKVVADIKEYGMVQRAYLGAFIRELNGDFARELDIDITEGVYIDSLIPESSAYDAGMKKGDVIIRIDENEIKTSPELLEEIGSHRPGDKVSITFIRDGKQNRVNVTLKNRSGNLDIVKVEESAVFQTLGAEFENVTDKRFLNKKGIEGGVRIVKIVEGKLLYKANIREGFIITRINNKTIKTIKDLEDVLGGYSGGVMVEGVYPNYSGVYYYAFGL
jgi:Do/DeqQ family serine protease